MCCRSCRHGRELSGERAAADKLPVVDTLVGRGVVPGHQVGAKLDGGRALHLTRAS